MIADRAEMVLRHAGETASVVPFSIGGTLFSLIGSGIVSSGEPPWDSVGVILATGGALLAVVAAGRVVVVTHRHRRERSHHGDGDET